MLSFSLHPIEAVIIVLYYVLLAALCLFSAHRFWLLCEYWRIRRRFRPLPLPAQSADDCPTVCVQLPLYNEPHVAERLIDAVCALEYPAEKLEIQVLDDSNDETSGKVADAVARWAARGTRIHHVRRPDRTGYKAGALQEGLTRTDAELVAIFDADFVPSADFLGRIVGEFNDPRVAMVQSRWEYLNAGESLLTTVQALMLDAHFRIEHAVRFAYGRFFNFNGTAGIWRRAAIDDAGGWQHDTLTEDLDLSYRAQLRGWKFIYRGDVGAPSELPALMQGYRSQQQRWAKGAMETARKILPALWFAPRLSFGTRMDASAHLLANSAWLMLVALLLLLFPMFLIREMHGLHFLMWMDLAAFLPTTIGWLLFLGTIARVRGHSWSQLFYLLPCALALGVGMSINNGVAALEGLIGRKTPFIRTPKMGAQAKASRQKMNAGNRLLPAVELAMSVYLILMTAAAVYFAVIPAMPFAVLFAGGFFYVATREFWRDGGRLPAPSRSRF